MICIPIPSWGHHHFSEAISRMLSVWLLSISPPSWPWRQIRTPGPFIDWVSDWQPAVDIRHTPSTAPNGHAASECPGVVFLSFIWLWRSWGHQATKWLSWLAAYFTGMKQMQHRQGSRLILRTIRHTDFHFCIIKVQCDPLSTCHSTTCPTCEEKPLLKVTIQDPWIDRRQRKREMGNVKCVECLIH